MAQDRVQLPSGTGGLMRYFDEYRSKIELKPGHIILFVILIVVIELVLHWQGPRWLGIA
ncbi:preprotein translocase subunit Sec61beta [Candidatus Woesearchaeota archaeon]|nr:preprotein translocase subunit Sec61beta [Candidatus Woesearchaeota archaeon]